MLKAGLIPSFLSLELVNGFLTPEVVNGFLTPEVVNGFLTPELVKATHYLTRLEFIELLIFREVILLGFQLPFLGSEYQTELKFVDDK